MRKKGFADIITLHANIDEPSDNNFVGTEFILDEVTDDDISNAKNLFLKFTGEQILETTRQEISLTKLEAPEKFISME